MQKFSGLYVCIITLPFPEDAMKSWSDIRKTHEQDRLAPSLRGRVQYFITRYREAHDDHGRVAIRVDGKEVFKRFNGVKVSES